MVILSPVKIRQTSRIKHLSATQSIPLLKQSLQDYFSKSGLHGVRYLGKKDDAWPEKLWWVVVILVSLTGSSLLILRVWNKWTTTPVLVTFAEHSSSIWEIPFPTVTFCPSVKYRKSIVNFEHDDVEANSSVNSDGKQFILDAMELLCRSSEEEGFDEGFDDRKKVVDDMIIDIHQAMSPNFPNALECQLFSGTNITCEELFQVLITREGVCFSFNLLPNRTLFSQAAVQYHQEPKYLQLPKNQGSNNIWSLEKGYIEGEGLIHQPIRAKGTGLRYGLTFLLKTNLSDIDYTCRILHGFKVTLTNPADIPEVDNSFFYMPMSGQTLMAVRPKVMDTSEALHMYSPDKRHCFFPTERKLAYFSTYTRSNCELECLTNFTLHYCNCVEFYMPRNETTHVCGVGSTNCVLKVKGLTRELTEEKIKKIKAVNDCNCLPSCKTIDYKADVSQSSIELSEIIKAHSMNITEYQNITVNLLYIYFKESEFIAKKRDELYGYADLIANCGSLLGLSCGFSALSLAELLYHFTLRLWNNNKQRGKVQIQRKELRNQLQKNPSPIWNHTFLY